MKQENRQQQLFKSLAQRKESRRSLAQWLCKTLSIDLSNAYRRLRGETELNLSELRLLWHEAPEYADLWLGFLDQGSNIYGRYFNFQQWESVIEFLTVTCKKWSEPGVSVYILAQNFPWPILLSHPTLLRLLFRMSPNLRPPIPTEVLKLSAVLYDCYCRVNTEEIWEVSGYRGLIEQISQHFLMGFIENGELIEIVEVLERQLKKVLLQLSQSNKALGGRFNVALLYSAPAHESAYFQAKRGQYQSGFLGGTGVLVASGLQAEVLFMDQWRAHLNLAVPISATNVKSRHQYFNELIREAKALPKMISEGNLMP